MIHPQVLELDASASVDKDDIDIGFDFDWHCEDASTGGACASPNGEALSTSSNEAFFSLPAGSLPIGKFSAFERKTHRSMSANLMIGRKPCASGEASPRH